MFRPPRSRKGITPVEREDIAREPQSMERMLATQGSRSGANEIFGRAVWRIYVGELRESQQHRRLDSHERAHFRDLFLSSNRRNGRGIYLTTVGETGSAAPLPESPHCVFFWEEEFTRRRVGRDPAAWRD